MGSLARFLPFAAIAACVWFLLGRPPAGNAPFAPVPRPTGSGSLVGDELRGYAESEAASAAGRVASALEIFKANTRYLANLPEIVSLEPAQAERAMHAQSRTHREIESLFLFDRAGNLIESFPKTRAPSAAWRAHVQVAVRTEELSLGGPAASAVGRVLLMAAPVRRRGSPADDPEGGVTLPVTTVGALGVEFGFAYVTSLALAGADRESLMMVSPDWSLLAGVPDDDIGTAEARVPAPVRAALTEPLSSAELPGAGQRTFFSAAPVPGTSWRVVVRRSLATARPPPPLPSGASPSSGNRAPLRAAAVALIALALGAVYAVAGRRRPRAAAPDLAPPEAEEASARRRGPPPPAEDAPTVRELRPPAPPADGGGGAAPEHALAEFEHLLVESRQMEAPVRPPRTQFRRVAELWNELSGEERRARERAQSAVKERDRLRRSLLEIEEERDAALEAAKALRAQLEGQPLPASSAPKADDDREEETARIPPPSPAALVGLAVPESSSADEDLAWRDVQLPQAARARRVEGSAEDDLKAAEFLFGGAPGRKKKKESEPSPAGDRAAPAQRGAPPARRGERLGPTPELSDLLRRRLDGLTDESGYDNALALFVNVTSDALLSAVGSTGVSKEVISSMRLRVGPRSGLVSAAAQDGNARIAGPETLSAAQDRSVAKLLGAERFVIAPFRDGRRVRGVLLAANVGAGRAVSGADVARLAGVAKEIEQEIVAAGA